MERMQGKAFAELRRKYELHMKWFSITNNGNIMVVVATKWDHQYYHYLNDEEKARFIQSDYYKNSYKHNADHKHRSVWYNHRQYPEYENIQNWQEANRCI